MSDSFDPYFKWLGVRSKERPPNHYHLLGIELYESDRELIDDSAARQMTYVRTFQTGKRSALSQQILQELTVAKLCLLDEQEKAAYDNNLRKSLAKNHTTAHVSESKVASAPPEPAPEPRQSKQEKPLSEPADGPAKTPQKRSPQGAQPQDAGSPKQMANRKTTGKPGGKTVKPEGRAKPAADDVAKASPSAPTQPSVPMSANQDPTQQPVDRETIASQSGIADAKTLPAVERGTTIMGVPFHLLLIGASVFAATGLALIVTVFIWLSGGEQREVTSTIPNESVVVDLGADVEPVEPPPALEEKVAPTPFAMNVIRREPQSPVAGGAVEVWIEADSEADSLQYRFRELSEAWQSTRDFPHRKRDSNTAQDSDQKGVELSGSFLVGSGSENSATPTVRQTKLVAGSMTLEVRAVDANGQVLGELKEPILVDENPLLTWRQSAALLHAMPIHRVSRSADGSKLAVVCLPPAPDFCGQVTIWDKAPAPLSVSFVPDLFAAIVRNDGTAVSVARRPAPVKSAADGDGKIGLRGSGGLPPQSYGEQSEDSAKALTLHVWQNQRCASRFTETGLMEAIVFSPGGNAIAALDDKKLHVWNTQGKVLAGLDLQNIEGAAAKSTSGTRLALSDNLEILAVAQPLSLWHLPQRRLIAAPQLVVNCLALSSDGALLATSSTGLIKTWNVADGSPQQTFDLVSLGNGQDTGSDTGKNRMSGGGLGGLGGGGLGGGGLGGGGFAASGTSGQGGESSGNGKTAAATAIAFNHTGDMLAAAIGGHVYIWRLQDGQLLRKLSGHTGSITCLTFFANGLVSGGNDKSVRFWSTVPADQKHISHTSPPPQPRLPIDIDNWIVEKKYGRALTAMKIFPYAVATNENGVESIPGGGPSYGDEEESPYGMGSEESGGGLYDPALQETYETLIAAGSFKTVYNRLHKLDLAQLPRWMQPKVGAIRSALKSDLSRQATRMLATVKAMPDDDQEKKERAEFAVYRDYPATLIGDDEWVKAQATLQKKRRDEATKLFENIKLKIASKLKRDQTAVERLTKKLYDNAYYHPDLAEQVRNMNGISSGGEPEGGEPLYGDDSEGFEAQPGKARRRGR